MSSLDFFLSKVGHLLTFFCQGISSLDFGEKPKRDHDDSTTYSLLKQVIIAERTIGQLILIGKGPTVKDCRLILNKYDNKWADTDDEDFEGLDDNDEDNNHEDEKSDPLKGFVHSWLDTDISLEQAFAAISV